MRTALKKPSGRSTSSGSPLGLGLTALFTLPATVTWLGYSAAGKLLAKVEVPHLAEVLKNQDQLRASAEAQIKAQKESIEEAKKAFTEQAKQLRR